MMKKILQRIGLFSALAVGIIGLSGTPNGAIAQEPTPDDDEGGGQVTLPTSTPTPIGGPTATPPRTATPSPVLVEVEEGPVNLRSGPSLDFDVVGELTAGDTLPITGRLLGFDWLRVRWEDGDAWIFEPLVIVRGDITTVEVLQPPPPPTINPAVLDAQATAEILVQTPGAVQTATAEAFFGSTEIVPQTPGAVGEEGGAPAPTFTPPPPINQPDVLGQPTQEQSAVGIPPAALIIGMVVFGSLMVVVGLVRRFF